MLLDPVKWHHSITTPDSIFLETYAFTRHQIQETILFGGYDVFIEVNCNVGAIIGMLMRMETITTIPKFGLDYRHEYITFCQEQYKTLTTTTDNNSNNNTTFEQVDPLQLTTWWKKINNKKKYQKPLIVCINNEILGLPIVHSQPLVVQQMLAIASTEGFCGLGFWNGNFFSHVMMNYYHVQQDLFGTMVDMQQFHRGKRIVQTKRSTGSTREDCTNTNHTNTHHNHTHVNNNNVNNNNNNNSDEEYSIEWNLPQEIDKKCSSWDIDVPYHAREFEPNLPQRICEGLAILVWFDSSCTTQAKEYYDSNDAQTFYQGVWGKETVHLGRYDLLSSQDQQQELSVMEQIFKAQALHQQEFLTLIRRHMGSIQPKFRIVDFGCGYGGLLRRLYDMGVVWSAIGCDISTKMCTQARQFNIQHGSDAHITILEESYLNTSIPDDTADLVISMESMLHVGPHRHHRVVREASRILRPGGWFIFTDIMERDDVDPDEMQPIYDRIRLTSMGTVSNYKDAMAEAGFTSIRFLPHSSNISIHYGNVLQLLSEKGTSIGLSPEFFTKMEHGLRVWRDMASNHLEWGFICGQYTRKVDLKSLYLRDHGLLL